MECKRCGEKTYRSGTGVEFCINQNCIEKDMGVPELKAELERLKVHKQNLHKALLAKDKIEAEYKQRIKELKEENDNLDGQLACELKILDCHMTTIKCRESTIQSLKQRIKQLQAETEKLKELESFDEKLIEMRRKTIQKQSRRIGELEEALKISLKDMSDGILDQDAECYQEEIELYNKLRNILYNNGKK